MIIIRVIVILSQIRFLVTNSNPEYFFQVDAETDCDVDPLSFVGKITGHLTHAGHGQGWARARARVGIFQPTRNPHPWVQARGFAWVFFCITVDSPSLAALCHLHRRHYLRSSTAATYLRLPPVLLAPPPPPLAACHLHWQSPSSLSSSPDHGPSRHSVQATRPTPVEPSVRHHSPGFLLDHRWLTQVTV